ncbi:MAG TPA: TIGR03663 family protein [Kouleothrix sp.]|uniref:flippase activity-associated protein Agl23 n=1 Tax=Kouleothrix sp. TaxID=2779161 RepID=UPI002BE07E83|nr:TIGR03663 family protein [Kouleothrix sp.]HRC74124.1 TIGR03663 family protein [Kouleothrix sp.]
MAAIPRETHDYTAPKLLDRAIDFSWLNLELLAFGLLVLLSIIAHLWALGHMAMHHDESVTSWMSWRYYTGASGFTCAGGRVAPSYCYDPVYHGPAYYVLSLASFFLFGDGEAQARLPEAIAGILLTASAWMLRPYLGRRGTFVAAALLAFSPALLYFTRFSRHDALIVLWAFWMVAGLFRYADTGRPRYLYLASAATALAMATHELYYILFFLFGTFVLARIAYERLPRRQVTIGIGVALLVAVVMMLLDPPITARLRGGGIGLLFSSVLGMALLLMRVWPEEPRFSDRVIALWRDERPVLWTALGILAGIFVLLFSNFFTDMRGVLDGLYQGLAYWLGSQHEYARGKQPWYYYLMLLPVYEPIALLGSFGAASVLFAWGRPRLAALVWMLVGALLIYAAGLFGTVGLLLGAALVGLVAYLALSGWWRGEPAPEITPNAAADALPLAPIDGAAAEDANGVAIAAAPAAEEATAAARPVPNPAPLFPLFLTFWFIGALVAFSWAGEKMPWLVTHIALPGNLLAAWAIGRMLDAIEWRKLPDRRAALIPVALVLALVAISVALWRFSTAGEGQAGQSAMLQAIVPLVIAGLLIFGLLTIGQRVGRAATLVIVALTLFGLLAAYSVRASWMVVYDHPDTPVEMLIYVQSPPDVPLIVRDIRTLAINLTRNQRTADDPTGGHSMPLILDAGDESSEGSLSWPYQWYLRDFQRIESRKADFFANATADSFLVPVDRNQPDGEKQIAPVVMVYVPHITDATRQALEENYVKRYDSKLNWYFPEGDLSGCDPTQPGYKRFYYNSSTRAQAKADPQCQSLNIDSLPYEPFYAPLVWPFRPENLTKVKNYLLYRELPDPLQIYGRDMQVWVRKDLVASGEPAAGGTSTNGAVKLVSEQVIGSPGNGAGQLTDPRGIAVDAQGNIYVADTANHRIQAFDAQGKPKFAVGSVGNGPGQFNEPRGVAVDAQGNIYVADTWNARVVKLDASGKFVKSWGTGNDIGNGRSAMMTDGTEAGNNAAPLGFYGPRGVAIDSKGNIYIADTGNKRVVVTDSEGTYLYQWGHGGNEPGAFNEPIGIAIDAQDDVYVADTWNGRVQVFGRDESGKVIATPKATWRVQGWQPNTYDDPFIAAGADGQVFVSVPSRNQVLYATIAGEQLLRWGGKGSDFASLTLPSGVAVSAKGEVYVVDRGNNRVMRFKMPNSGG